MANNVVIKRRVAATNIDSYNRSAVATTNVPNGSVFSLKEKDSVNELLYKAVAPKANEKGLWMATSPEVIYVDKTHGGSADPRDFVNVAGRAIDATYLVPADIIEMTGEGITGIATAAYLVADTSMTLKAATTAPTAGGLALRKIGTGTLKIGDGAIAPAVIPTYVFEVEAN